MAVGLSGIRKRFGGHFAVEGVSAEIAEEEFFVVLGPSGCGKSTLLRMIAGLERLDGGEITLSGSPVSGPGLHVPPERRDVGVVFQSYALWPHMDVGANVAFPLESAGKSRGAARAEAETYLKTVDLLPFRDRRPSELSGGQRQRVALARCLAGGARTVLMDEPLANLDPHLRATMEEEIAAFHRRAGATTIYITHDQREAMALATRVAVMARGQFQQVAAPQDLYERPATAEVARFIGRSAILDATLHGRLATIAGQQVSVQRQHAGTGPVSVVIRPGDIRLGAGPITATLDGVFYRGGVWEGVAQVQGLDQGLPIASPRPLRTGETVRLSIDSGWVLPPASDAPGHDARRQSSAEAVE